MIRSNLVSHILFRALTPFRLLSTNALLTSTYRSRRFPNYIQRWDSNASKPLLTTDVQDVKSIRKELQADWVAPILTYDEIKRRTQQPKSDAFLIDVREPDEVVQGSIPSSVNIPLSVLATSLHLPEGEFKKKHGFEKPRKGQEIVFYCRSGKRSATACDVARRNGFDSVLNYEGSWLDWNAKNPRY